jgi:hypothetical protein
VNGTPCRFCGAELRQSFVDLGRSPLANAFLAPDELRRMEPFYLLHGAVRLAPQPMTRRSRAASVLFGRRNSNDLVPWPKGKVTSGTILVGGEAVTAELEMTVDSTMGRKKALGLSR